VCVCVCVCVCENRVTDLNLKVATRLRPVLKVKGKDRAESGDSGMGSRRLSSRCLHGCVSGVRLCVLRCGSLSRVGTHARLRACAFACVCFIAV